MSSIGAEGIDRLYGIVGTGVVPDGGGISFGNGKFKVDVRMVPRVFREMETELRNSGNPGDIVLALGYRDMADVVEKVVRGERPAFLQSPENGFVGRLVDSFPVSPDSVCTLALNKLYVQSVARVTYGDF